MISIRNNTGQVLELFDGVQPLMTLANGEDGRVLPITITGMNLNGAPFHRLQGSFVTPNDYAATLVPAGGNENITFVCNDPALTVIFGA